MSSPLTDYQLRHYRALIERERTHAGETAAGILLAATLARLQHCERRLAQAESTIEALRDISEQDCPYRDNCPAFGSNHGACDGCKSRRALAAWAPIEGQEP